MVGRDAFKSRHFLLYRYVRKRGITLKHTHVYICRDTVFFKFIFLLLQPVAVAAPAIVHILDGLCVMVGSTA